MRLNRTFAFFWLILAVCAPAAGEDPAQEPDFPVPPLLLTSRGRTIYEIALGEDPAEYEVFAAEELAKFIERSTGARLRVTGEGSRGSRHAVYLGDTAFAAGEGIDSGGFGPEEWIIKAAGDNLIIAGGRPRGTLYGAYEFLEEFLGVRFLNPRIEHVPSMEELTVPANTEMRGMPVFSRREIHMFVCVGWIERNRRFMVRSRMNTVGNTRSYFDPKYGFMTYGSPRAGHAAPRYVRTFPEAFDKDIYFAVDIYGDRYEREGLGKHQVCMSHPEVREIFSRKIRVFIESDRRDVLESGRGEESFPRVYGLSPADGHSKCYCELCMEREKKYGSYAGVMLEFANYLADEIAEDFPEIWLSHLVYTYYRDLPEGIRPRDNVMPMIAQLGSVYWNRPPRRDVHRSMLHPLNKDARREFEEWAKISRKIAVWDYWLFHWGQPHQWPHSDVKTVAENMKFFYEQGVHHYLTEASLTRSVLNFLDLKYYLASRMMLHPTGDPESIIDEFMGLYYGAAAESIRELMEYMERRQEELQWYLELVPPEQRPYYDVEYFLEADRMLREAEEAVPGDEARLAALRQERLPFDETILFLWEKLTAEAGENWPFEREEVLERVEAGYEELLNKYGAPMLWRQRVEDRIEFLREGKPVERWFL